MGLALADFVGDILAAVITRTDEIVLALCHSVPATDADSADVRPAACVLCPFADADLATVAAWPFELCAPPNPPGEIRWGSSDSATGK